MIVDPLFDFLAGRSYRWHIDAFNGRALRGWVSFRRAPYSPSVVAISQNGIRLCPPVVTQPRDDLTAASLGPAGFDLDFGTAHFDWIDIEVTNPESRLGWTTIQRRLRRPVGSGLVDTIRDGTITGWAACFEPEAREVAIEVHAGETLVARGRPSIPRDDVAARFMLSSNSVGFAIKVPWRFTDFERLTLTGVARDKRFPIVNTIAPADAQRSFTEVYRYASGNRFWS